MPGYAATAALLLCLVLGLPGTARPQEAVPPSGEMLELERSLFRALHANGREELERLLSVRFVSRGAPEVDRETWLDNAISYCWGDRSEIEDFAVRSVGETRVATFVLTLFADPVTCEDAILRSLVTDVWAREDGRWRLVLRHSGPVGGPGVESQFENVPLPPPLWEATAELSLVSTGGNAETETLGAAGELHYRPGPWHTAVESGFVRSEATGAENARSFSVEARQSRTISDRLELFARGGFLQDRFAGIDARLATDGGLAVTVFDRERHVLRVDLGAGFTREERLAGGDLSFAIANFVSDYEWTLTDTTALTSETRFTANLDDGENWRFNERVGLSAGLTTLFSLKLSYALKFINLPVPGFEKTDTILSAAFVTTFSRR